MESPPSHRHGYVSLCLVAAVFLALVGIPSSLWWSQREIYRVPSSSLAPAWDQPVDSSHVRIEKEANGDHHLYLKGLESREDHVERPLHWKRVLASDGLGVEFQPEGEGATNGSFRFWLGKANLQGDDGTVSRIWFDTDGNVISEEEARKLAVAREIDLDNRWWDERPREPKHVRYRMVGGFEGVAGGALLTSHVYAPPAREPLSFRKQMHAGAKSPPQYMAFEVPTSGIEDLYLTSDFIFGDSVATLSPQVGATATFPDGLSAEILLVLPFPAGAPKSKRDSFVQSFREQKLRVSCTTICVFFSDPALAQFVYPKMIHRNGREEIRYFLNAADIRSVTMPIKHSLLANFELHYRQHRYRGVFPMRMLPVPDVP